jgi:hypothetical protein
MTPGKVSAITPPRTSDQAAKHVRKPTVSTDPDSALSTDGTVKPHIKEESFIIPGTATGPDRPLVNPEKTAAVKTIPNIPITGPVSTAGAGSPVREQHQ